MIVSLPHGQERGHCEKCRAVYDTRTDPHAGAGMCGRCYRWRFRPDLSEPVAPPVCTFSGLHSATGFRAIARAS